MKWISKEKIGKEILSIREKKKSRNTYSKFTTFQRKNQKKITYLGKFI